MKNESVDILKYSFLLDNNRRKVPQMYVDNATGETVRIQWKKNKGFVKL